MRTDVKTVLAARVLQGCCRDDAKSGLDYLTLALFIVLMSHGIFSKVEV